MVVQHLCAEEHRPAQPPAATAVGWGEKLSLDAISSPSNLKYPLRYPFLPRSSHVVPSLLYFCSWSLSVKGHGLMQNPCPVLSQMVFAAIWICDRGEKSYCLLWARPLAGISLPHEYVLLCSLLLAWVFSNVFQFLLHNQGRKLTKI